MVSDFAQFQLGSIKLIKTQWVIINFIIINYLKMVNIYLNSVYNIQKLADHIINR